MAQKEHYLYFWLFAKIFTVGASEYCPRQWQTVLAIANRYSPVKFLVLVSSWFFKLVSKKGEYSDYPHQKRAGISNHVRANLRNFQSKVTQHGLLAEEIVYPRWNRAHHFTRVVKNEICNSKSNEESTVEKLPPGPLAHNSDVHRGIPGRFFVLSVSVRVSYANILACILRNLGYTFWWKLYYKRVVLEKLVLQQGPLGKMAAVHDIRRPTQ